MCSFVLPRYNLAKKFDICNQFYLVSCTLHTKLCISISTSRPRQMAANLQTFKVNVLYKNWCSLLLALKIPVGPLDNRSSIHYDDVIMSAIASQITSLTIVYSIVYSDQRKYQSSASLAFVRGIHRGPVNSPHKWPVTRKMFPFDDVIMLAQIMTWWLPGNNPLSEPIMV